MTDWTAKARDIRPGDRYRILGPGYRARTAGLVAHMCNCQNPRARTLDETPVPAPCPPGHNAASSGGTPLKHYAVVIVTASAPSRYARDTVELLPHQLVTMTG